MGGAKIPEGVPISLGNLAWGCQILGGARFPMTAARTLAVYNSPSVHFVAVDLKLAGFNITNVTDRHVDDVPSGTSPRFFCT